MSDLHKPKLRESPRRAFKLRAKGKGASYMNSRRKQPPDRKGPKEERVSMF